MEIIFTGKSNLSKFADLEIGYNFRFWNVDEYKIYVKSSQGTAIDLKAQELENFKSEDEVEEIEITKLEYQLIY